MTNTFDWIIENAQLVTFADLQLDQGSDNSILNDYGLIEDGVLAVRGNTIVFAGSSEQWHAEHQAAVGQNIVDAKGKVLTPGLIDCHTHLVFGGNRAQEFEWRLNGESYQDIARKGGGILSTVRQTRNLSEQELFDQSAPRMERLLEEGVTTIEIKSGYGLNTQTELKMLRVAKELEKQYPVTIKTTLLAAHALPPEFRELEGGQQAYIDYVCEDTLPTAKSAGLVDAVDVFCEGIGFSPSQCEQVFQAAKALGLPIKAHVEQLSDLKGAVLTAKYDGLSVDHLEYLQEEDVNKLRNTVAVLLPGAFYCLNETQKPPVQALRDKHVPMAVATDLNPGTSPIASLLYAINQACVLFNLTPQEALKGATANAALALGFEHKGRLASSYDADFLLWDIAHPADLAYGVNFHRPRGIWQNGNQVKKS